MNHRKIGFVLVFLLAIASSACSTHLGSANTPTQSDAEAEANIASRLDESARVRTELNQLRDALRKVDGVLKFVGSVLNQRVDVHPGGVLIDLLDQVPDALGSLTRSLLVREVDGTWAAEAPILSGASLHDITQCPSLHIRLTLRKVLDQDDAVLYLSDCSGMHWDRLAKWIVKPDGAIDMSYWPAVMANLRPTEGDIPSTSNVGSTSGNCSLALVPLLKSAVFSCVQTLPSNGQTMPYVLETLSVSDVADGTSASITMGLYSFQITGGGTSSTPKGALVISLQPNQSPSIQLCKGLAGEQCATL